METIVVKLSDPTRIFTDASGENEVVLIGDKALEIENTHVVAKAVQEGRLKVVRQAQTADHAPAEVPVSEQVSAPEADAANPDKRK